MHQNTLPTEKCLLPLLPHKSYHICCFSTALLYQQVFAFLYFRLRKQKSGRRSVIYSCQSICTISGFHYPWANILTAKFRKFSVERPKRKEKKDYIIETNGPHSWNRGDTVSWCTYFKPIFCVIELNIYVACTQHATLRIKRLQSNDFHSNIY